MDCHEQTDLNLRQYLITCKISLTYGVFMMFKLLFLSIHLGCEGKENPSEPSFDPDDHQSQVMSIMTQIPSQVMIIKMNHLRNPLVNPMVKKVLLPKEMKMVMVFPMRKNLI